MTNAAPATTTPPPTRARLPTVSRRSCIGVVESAQATYPASAPSGSSTGSTVKRSVSPETVLSRMALACSAAWVRSFVVMGRAGEPGGAESARRRPSPSRTRTRPPVEANSSISRIGRRQHTLVIDLMGKDAGRVLRVGAQAGIEGAHQLGTEDEVDLASEHHQGDRQQTRVDERQACPERGLLNEESHSLRT